MSIFFPDERFHRITDIPVEKLLERGFEGIILDVDNTLTTHDNPVPAEGVINWLQTAAAAGIKLMILSNNSPERVRPFAELLGLEFVSNGKKPLPQGYRHTLAKMGIKGEKALAVGDQIFTDVLGAGLAGIYCIFVDPIEPEKTAFFKLKRALEKPILALFERSRRR